MQDHHAFYLRMEAKNESGVLAKITRILAQQQINIESILQKEHHEGNAQIVVITNPVQEQRFRSCLTLIQEAAYMISVKAIRVHVWMLFYVAASYSWSDFNPEASLILKRL